MAYSLTWKRARKTHLDRHLYAVRDDSAGDLSVLQTTLKFVSAGSYSAEWKRRVVSYAVTVPKQLSEQRVVLSSLFNRTCEASSCFNSKRSALCLSVCNATTVRHVCIRMYHVQS